MGGTRRSGAEMVAFTEEALQIMRRGAGRRRRRIPERPARDRGLRSRAGAAGADPAVAGQPGAADARRHRTPSDGWVSPLSTYMHPAAVPARQQQIDEAARAAGRDPAAVRRIYNVVGAIGARSAVPG